MTALEADALAPDGDLAHEVEMMACDDADYRRAGSAMKAVSTGWPLWGTWMEPDRCAFRRRVQWRPTFPMAGLLQVVRPRGWIARVTRHS